MVSVTKVVHLERLNTARNTFAVYTNTATSLRKNHSTDV